MRIRIEQSSFSVKGNHCEGGKKRAKKIRHYVFFSVDCGCHKGDSCTQGLFIAYFHIGRGINRDPVMTSEDTESLMAQLWAASLAYYWYVRGSVMVRFDVDGRVPSFDMRLLLTSGALWFMVSSYAPWS